jgi:hypothetical protein
LEICRPTGSLAEHLGWRVHADEDNICFVNMAVDIRGEEKILSPCLADNFVQARLIDRKLIGLPRCNTRLIDIDDDDRCSGQWLAMTGMVDPPT